ncbi:hypothetical protein D3C71_1814360 [compost metagenome]
MEQHAGEADHARVGQAALARRVGEGLRDVLTAAQAQITAKHFRRAAGQCQGHAVDQCPDGGHHRHAQYQRGEHRQQIAGQELTAQCTRRMAHDIHAPAPATVSARRPPSSW